MQDDQLNVMNSFKAQNLDVDDSTLSSAAGNSNKENNTNPLTVSKTQKANETLLHNEEKKDGEKQNVRRSKRRINDKKNLCT